MVENQANWMSCPQNKLNNRVCPFTKKCPQPL